MNHRTSYLVADIGGTNARFALLEEGSEDRPSLSNISVLPCEEFDSVEACCQHYLQSIHPDKPTHAVLALAGPIHGEVFEMTNRGWRFSISQLQTLLGLQSLYVINDFMAQAYNLISPNPNYLTTLLANTKGLQESTSALAPKVVLGAGTGLGIAALTPHGHRWQVVASEAGQMRLAACSDLSLSVIHYLRQYHDYLSYEHLLSGPGIFRLYQALRAIQGESAENNSVCNAEAVSHLAVNHDCPMAKKTIQVFFELLASFAGDMALNFVAKGGIYLSGGIIPKNLSLMNTAEFARQFRSKGAMSPFLEDVPVHVIFDNYAALQGVGFYLKNRNIQTNK